MAACGESEPISPLENRSFSDLNSPIGTESKSVSRSPSLSSFDRWPSLLVSRKLHSSGRNINRNGNARDPVIIERRNLVNISKLIVKELIETSLKYGRMLDSDHMPLQHFFIVLEHVLRHGLKPKKGLLGPKKELWDILQVVEKLTSEAQDITSSVRDLPTVRTQMGRARAWLRLALMQKKLADYTKVLIDHRDDVLVEYFEPDALMMSEEANIIEGLLTGLNVIDCNLCVKEEDLDCQQGVIDFSLYLRSTHHPTTSTNEEDSLGGPDEDLDPDNMTTVLDQKNYIEELNRHLNATVGNLQAKVESLTTTNALMKEDLAIARKNISVLMEENSNLKSDRPEPIGTDRKEETTEVRTRDSELETLHQQLIDETKLRHETERELHLQVSLKAEMEVAMKLLEKDIHEKQDTIISLRRQLDDIKQINLEMYKKLQECESSLKQKTELITKLEDKTCAMTDTLQILDEKQREYEQMKLALHRRTTETEERNSGLEGELKMEKQKSHSLQSSMVDERERISNLQQEVKQLQAVATKYVSLQESFYKLSEQCKEQELTLQELGIQLSKSKLQVSDLQEEASVSRTKPDAALWASDKEATHCKACEKEFNITRRRHHCRNCGEIFCNACSDNTMSLAASSKPVRVCDDCHEQLIARYSIVQ